MIEIGCVYDHPVHGIVYVESGSYMVNSRVSNFWHFKKVNQDGSLGCSVSGYGGSFKKLDADVRITVTVKA